MPNLEQLKDAITAASASPLAFAACLVLVFVGLAYSWFGSSKTPVKLIVFFALFVAAGMLFGSQYVPPPPPATVSSVDRGSYVIDFQYTGSRDKAAEVQAVLQRKGWVIYGLDAEDGFRPTIVKYGADSNRLAAEALRDDLQAAKPQVAPVRFARDPKIKPTHLEVWVGFP